MLANEIDSREGEIGMENWKKIWDGLNVDATMHLLLERTRQCRGIAMDVCGETMDYESFHARSDAGAAWLQSRDYARGAIVMLSMAASLDLFCMMAAVIKAGMTVLVTEAEVPEARLRELYAQTNAVLRITDDDVEAIYAAGEHMRLRPVTDTVLPDDVYAIWYTSGTTGVPCGIQTTARNTVCNIIPEPGNEILSGCLQESSALLSISHPSFGVGFTNFFYALFYGIKFVHIEMGHENSIREIARKIRENRGCFLLFTPSAVAACMLDEKAKASFKYCKAVMMGADKVSQSLMRTVQEAMGPEGKVVNLYGISDVGLVAAKIAGENDRLHAIGKPTAYTSFIVVDDERKALPPGVPGELCITGIRVGPGYLKATAGKADRFVHQADGQRFFYTGDYGYIGEDGEVYLLGRVDRRIKHLGFRVDAAEIEETLRKKARVRNAAVKQFEQGDRQILCAFYESDEIWEPDALRSIVAADLPRYCVPERFVHMAALPLTERGKLDYRALTLPDSVDYKQFEPPKTEAERAICAVFEDVLHIPGAGRDSSFFELGGDSITGTIALAMLGEKYGIHRTIVELFQNPKPMDLARLSEAKRAEESLAAAQNPDPAFVLPPEIRHLAEREDAEAVYPADPASAHFAFLEETGSAFVSGDLHFNLRADLERSFSEQEIRGRVRALVRRHPVLRSCFVKDSEGKRWQVFRKDMEVPVWYRSLDGLGDAARERFFSGFFRVMDEEKAAFQVACFPVGKDSCTLLLRLVHTQADGMSCVILLNELADGVPEGQDAFYAYREKRLNNRFLFPKELQEYYQGFGGAYRLPRTPPKNADRVAARRISLTAGETSALKERCGQRGITLPFYVEYCFGSGLLSILNRETVWFSHVFSGRDNTFEGCESIVGNLICSMPVRLQRGMTPAEFQKSLLIPWNYPYVTDTEEFRALNRPNIEFGVVSRIFPSINHRISFFTDYPEAFSRGLYLELTEGKLQVILRYPDNEAEQKTLDVLESTMARLLLQGP